MIAPRPAHTTLTKDPRCLPATLHGAALRRKTLSA